MIIIKNKLDTYELATMGIMLGVIEVAKISLSLILGVELVTLLFIISTITFKNKTFYLLGSFLLVEGLLNGFGIWWFMYVYIWLILILIVLKFQNNKSVLFWSVLSGMFGLIFGALCFPIYFIVGGVDMAFSWWVAGITTDVIHGISNFVLCMILFYPLSKLAKKLTIDD